MEKANITDKDGNHIYFGDTFWAYIMQPSASEPVKVTVVEDRSQNNLDCDRNFDVEDGNGKRIWNAYMVISNGERGDVPHTWDGGKEWLEFEKKRIKEKEMFEGTNEALEKLTVTK